MKMVDKTNDAIKSVPQVTLSVGFDIFWAISVSHP
jgi:hypothetical protein